MSSKPSEKRQVVRFAFYKLDSAWRRLPAERQASAKLEFGETIESFAGRLLLRPYGLVGIRGDCDFLLWQVAEDLDSLVALQTALNRTDLGAYLAVPYSYLAMTRRSIYEFPEAPGAGQPSRLVIRPSDARYLFVYPFIKTRAWYMLPKAERQLMMDEHVRVGRQYPSIRHNTTGVRRRRCRRALQRERHRARHRQPLHARARQPLRRDRRPGPLRGDVPLARRRLFARDRAGAERAAVAAGRHLSREGRGRHGPRRSPGFDRRGRADRCPPLLTTAVSSRRAARSPPM